MKKGKKDILMIRIVSTLFSVVALAIFKPFGLGAWQWQAYVHLLNIMILGVAVCMLTDTIMRYLLKMPCDVDDDRNVNFFIRRNLYFQIINTVLITLMICFYRHLLLSDRVAANRFSWGNFFETLLIMAFLSFAIGLYWRFKFRSRYLAAELNEMRLLNEQLQKKQKSDMAVTKPVPDAVAQPSPDIVLTGNTNETVTLQIANLLYVEAVGNYVKVYHLQDGQARTDMLRATSKQIEDELHAYPMIVRCHRAFLVNLAQVDQIVSRSGTMQLLIRHSHESIPVSRSNMAGIKAAING